MSCHLSDDLVCPSCGSKLNGATDPVGDATPSSGDITVCLYCGHILVFTDDLRLRNPTDEEIHEIAGDVRILAIQRARAKLSE